MSVPSQPYICFSRFGSQGAKEPIQKRQFGCHAKTADANGSKGLFEPREALFGAPEVLGRPRGARFGPNCPPLHYVLKVK